MYGSNNLPSILQSISNANSAPETEQTHYITRTNTDIKKLFTFTVCTSRHRIMEATGHHRYTEPQQGGKRRRTTTTAAAAITVKTSESSKNTPIFHFNRRGTTTQTILVQDLKY
jgi:hypothetical protein